jgi:hypothetical protein
MPLAERVAETWKPHFREGRFFDIIGVNFVNFDCRLRSSRRGGFAMDGIVFSLLRQAPESPADRWC